MFWINTCKQLAGVARLLTATCLTTALGFSVAAQAQTSATQDLGALPDNQTVQVTVWLKKRKQAAFDVALTKIYDKNSPQYHQWMTPAQLASYGPEPEDLAVVKAQLLTAGLQVVRVADDRASIEVTGRAGLVQNAFSTSIHAYTRGTTSFYAAVQEPTLHGAAASLVASVTGLHSAAMRPMFLSRLDGINGEPVRMSLTSSKPSKTSTTGSPLNPYLTDDCFHGSASVNLSSAEAQGSVTLTGRTMADDLYGSGNQVCGYDANQIRTHYGLGQAATLGLDGQGQTIVIVVAYGSSTLLSDVNLYSNVVGLPQLDDANFKLVAPLGQPINSDQGWGEETTIDVTMAHAIAPKAKIVLLVAPSAEDSDLGATLHYGIVHQLGSVFSLSWGQPENGSDPGVAASYAGITGDAAALGIGVNVASGDSGDNGVGSPIGGSGIPADSPYVTSVGGTTVALPTAEGTRDIGWGWQSTTPNNGRVVKTQFNLGLLGFVGAGGGESSIFLKPAWQKRLPGVGRQQPDVAALADPLTGIDLVDTSYVNGALFQVLTVVGGTSVATPIFSGFMALANQLAGHRLGQAAPLVATMPSWAIDDILPLTKKEPVAIVTAAGKALSFPDMTPAGLALLPASTKNLEQIFVSRPIFSETIFTFGYDSSLTVKAGWDNVTGYGEPHGLGFLAAAAIEGLGVPLSSNASDVSLVQTLMRTQQD